VAGVDQLLVLANLHFLGRAAIHGIGHGRHEIIVDAHVRSRFVNAHHPLQGVRVVAAILRPVVDLASIHDPGFGFGLVGIDEELPSFRRGDEVADAEPVFDVFPDHLAVMVDLRLVLFRPLSACKSSSAATIMERVPMPFIERLKARVLKSSARFRGMPISGSRLLSPSQVGSSTESMVMRKDSASSTSFVPTVHRTACVPTAA
jgi:hypothetical protein